MFFFIFTRAGTASNYVSYIPFGCWVRIVETRKWDDGPLCLAVKGLTKRRIENHGDVKKCDFLLTESDIRTLVTHSVKIMKQFMALWQSCSSGSLC